MCDWLRSGYSWADSKTHLKTLSLSTAPERAISMTSRADAMKRLRENAAKTYAPRGARLGGGWGWILAVANTTDGRVG